MSGSVFRVVLGMSVIEVLLIMVLRGMHMIVFIQILGLKGR